MKERLLTIFIFCIIVASSFYFGFGRLQNYSGVDEHYWVYDRVPDFWSAVEKGKWKKTNISDKPGVSLAIVSGAGLNFISDNPKYYEQYRYKPKTPVILQKIRDAHFWLRLPVFLFTLAVLPLFYFLIKKLLGKRTARFALLFIGLSPILLGISLIINSDAMLWILTALSILSLFVFFKIGERKYILLSGFFLGLSVITKYVANVLFVYFFLLFFLEYVFFAREKIPVAKYLKQALASYAILFAAAMVTAFAFFPATWVDLSKLLSATVGNDVFKSTWPLFAGVIGLVAVDTLFFKAKFSGAVFDFLAKRRRAMAITVGSLFLVFSAFVFLHIYTRLNVFDLQAIIASPKGIGDGNVFQRYGGAITADVYSFLFSISPLVLLAVLFAVGNLFKKEEIKRDMITAVYIVIFAFIFYLGSAVNDVVTTVRYQIVVYPLMFVLAAIGAARFLEIEKIRKYVPAVTMYLVSAIVLLASLALVRPHYLAYASELLPKSHIVNLKGMGEGSIQAAQYLNSLPGAENMTIWSDKGAVCEAFFGRCFINFERETFRDNGISYFVVSADRRSRSLKMSENVRNTVDFEQLYNGNHPPAFEEIIGRNPNNFVKVFKAADFLKE